MTADEHLHKIGATARRALEGSGSRLELRAALILILDETRRAAGEPAHLRTDHHPETR